jgi:SAM-dependent methyltransferase
MNPQPWTADRLSQLLRGYQPSCVLTAAAELNLFALLVERPRTAAEVAHALSADLRATRTLLDALVALELLARHDDAYQFPPELADLLLPSRPGAGVAGSSQLALAQHHANCLRHWAQLSAVVLTGKPADPIPSTRGPQADYAAFIEAMDNTAQATAGTLVASLQPLSFTHLLDVGGASGSYTIAFLRAHPAARATLFDLPPVMPQARERLAFAGLLSRVTLAPGDFYTDPLPAGADLAWVSAIIHQNSRPQNQDLFRRVHQALIPGGRILIRDFIMEENRAHPPAGALFAVNMLVRTPAGGTFTFAELREDLALAGFIDVNILLRSDTMNSILTARKPE